MPSGQPAVQRLGKRLAWACWCSFILFLLLADSFHRFVMEVAWLLHAWVRR